MNERLRPIARLNVSGCLMVLQQLKVIGSRTNNGTFGKCMYSLYIYILNVNVINSYLQSHVSCLIVRILPLDEAGGWADGTENELLSIEKLVLKRDQTCQ